MSQSQYILKPSNAGVYQINALNVNNLTINGVPFQSFINDLVAGDQFEQGEIDELKLLVQYLNTSGLSSEWIVDNNNKNQDLKSLITGLQSITGNIQANTQYLRAPYSGSGVDPTSYFINGLQVWNGDSEAGTGIFSYKDGSSPAHQIELKTESSKNIKLGGGSVVVEPKSTGTVSIGNGDGNFLFKVGDNTKQNYGELSKVLMYGEIELSGSGSQNGIKIYDEPIFGTQLVKRKLDLKGDSEVNIFGGRTYLQAGSSTYISMSEDINLRVQGGSSPGTINIQVDGDVELNKLGKINIGTLQDTTALGYTEIQIGQNGPPTALRTSSTFLDGDTYVPINPLNPQLYDYMLYAGLPSVYGGALRGKIKTTFTPYFKSLSCFSIEPTINSFVQSSGTFTVAVGLGAITLNAGLGGCLMNAAGGLLGMTSIIGGIAMTTGGGGIAMTTGAGACAITTGAGPIQFQTSSGDIIIDSGSQGLAGSTYITPKEYLILNPEESIIIGQSGNKPIYTSLIDTNYQFYGNIFQDAGVLGNMITSNILTTGNQPVYLRPSTTAQIQLAANVAGNLLGNVSMILKNKDLGSTIYTSSESNITPDSTYATFVFGSTDLPLPLNANIEAQVYVSGNIQNYRYRTWESNANLAGTIGATVNAVVRPAVNSSSHFVNINGTVRFQDQIDTVATIELTSQANQNKTIISNNFITTTGSVESASLLTNSISPKTTLAITANTIVANDYFQGKALKIDPLWAGSTTNALYNVEGILYFNGAKVDSGGGSGGGGIEYYIPLATSTANPAPNPTTQIMDDVYNSNPLRSIAQSTTAVATGLLMARYITQVFNKDSNPVLTGLQTVQQWLTWSENNVVGQIYGRLWYEAYISNNNILYDKKYTNTLTTSYATVVNGTPIIAPVSLFEIAFQTVLFQFIDIDVSGTSCVIKCRLEQQDLITENWTTIQESAGTKTYTSDTTGQVLDFQNENFSYIRTSTVSAPPRYRVSLFVSNGGGVIRQTTAGGTDLGAYQLGSSALGTASIRVLLYDGTNQKKTIPHSTEPILFPLELPVAVPYNISAFNYSRLSFDLYFYQPSGSVNANHIMTFFYNDGAISHVETSINLPPEGIPTLAQVMASGSKASVNLDMDTFGITNVSSIQNWNVKEITAGTNITRSITNGNYTITNSAPVQDIGNTGTNITVSKTSNVATITNSAPVQDIGNTGTNISVSIDSGTKTATINNNAPVQNVIAGPGIEVQINATTKTATINNLGVSGQATRDEDNVIVDVGAQWRKPDYWLNNWADSESSSREHQDIYVSVDGSIVVSAAGSAALISSRDYGVSYTFAGTPSNISWTAVGGTSQGSKLYAFGSETTVPTQQIVLYTSLDYGLTWTRFTSPAFFAEISRINKVRTSGDGRYVIATDNSQPGTAAKFLYSSDSGATFTRRSLTEPTGPNGHTYGVCISRSGATQFITLRNIRGDAQANSGVYRSFDYGATFVAVQNYITDSNSIKAYWHNIDCDATGRFVWASRYNDTSSNPWAFYSADYGATWKEASVSGIIDIVVSGSGQHIAAIRNPSNIGGTPTSFILYSSNYGQQFNSALVATTLFSCIGSNSDLTNVFIGSGLPSSGDGKLRVARQGRQNIQDLSVVGGTITKVGGLYTIPLDTTLHASGSIYTNNHNIHTINWGQANKIDLTQYNIKYEIDITWDYPGTTLGFVYMDLYINAVSPKSSSNSGTAYTGITNWVNSINNTSGGVSNTHGYAQTYHGRMFVGFSPDLDGISTDFRQRSLLTGEISLNTRTVAQPGITDNSVNSRLIYNRLQCDGTWIVAKSATEWGVSVDTGSFNTRNHQRIVGTALFDASMNGMWNLFDNSNEALSQGVYQLLIGLTDGGTQNRARQGRINYRIYKVRK